MTNIIFATILLLRRFFGTLVVTVDVAVVILGHHGVGPEIAGHSLGHVLLNRRLLGARQQVGTLNLGITRIFSVEINAFQSITQHLRLKSAHLKQSLAIVEVGLSALEVRLAELLGEDGATLGHVINSFRDIEVFLHALQQILSILHATKAIVNWT